MLSGNTAAWDRRNLENARGEKDDYVDFSKQKEEEDVIYLFEQK